MDTKLTFTIYDIITHLLPGAGILIVLNRLTGWGKDFSDPVLIFTLSVFGYLLGSIISLVGVRLFWYLSPDDYKGKIWYWPVYGLDLVISKFPLLKVKNTSEKVKPELITIINKKFSVDLAKDRLGLFNFADTLVSASDYPERDTLLAKEGLFRTLTCLSFFSFVYFVFTPPVYNKWATVVASLLLTEFLRFGREYYRTLKNQQVYCLALIKMKSK